MLYCGKPEIQNENLTKRGAIARLDFFQKMLILQQQKKGNSFSSLQYEVVDIKPINAV